MKRIAAVGLTLAVTLALSGPVGTASATVGFQGSGYVQGGPLLGASSEFSSGANYNCEAPYFSAELEEEFQETLTSYKMSGAPCPFATHLMDTNECQVTLEPQAKGFEPGEFTGKVSFGPTGCGTLDVYRYAPQCIIRVDSSSVGKIGSVTYRNVSNGVWVSANLSSLKWTSPECGVTNPQNATWNFTWEISGTSIVNQE